MNSDREPTAQLAPLVEQLLDGRLTAETHYELSALLAADPVARREYLELLQVHGVMREELGAIAAFDPETGTFVWTPGYDRAGTYEGVRFEVTDGTDTDWEEIVITVTEEGTLVVVRLRGSRGDGLEGGTVKYASGSWHDFGVTDENGEAEGVLPAGITDIPWDGRDAAGHTVASGVYFLEAIHAEGRDVRKVTLVR